MVIVNERHYHASKQCPLSLVFRGNICSHRNIFALLGNWWGLDTERALGHRKSVSAKFPPTHASVEKWTLKLDDDTHRHTISPAQFLSTKYTDSTLVGLGLL